MKYLVVLVIFNLLNAGIDAAPAASKGLKTSELQHENCPRGLRFYDDDGCNRCFCVPETGAVGCTMMLCEGPLEQEAKFLKTPELRGHEALKNMNTSEVAWTRVPIGGRCPEFVAPIDSCNTCFCNPATGIVGCTMMACPEMNYVETKSNHENTPASKSLKTSESLCQDFLLHNTDDNCECNPETGLVQCTLYIQHSEYETDHGPIRISKSMKSSGGSESLCPEFTHDNCDCNPETGMITCTIDHGRDNIVHGPIRISKSLKTSAENLCPEFTHDNCDCNPETGMITCTIDHGRDNIVHGPIRISKSMKTSEDTGSFCPEFLDDNCECLPEAGLIMCVHDRGMDIIDHGPIRISKSLKTSEDTESLCQDYMIHNPDNNCECNPETGLLTCTLSIDMSQIDIVHGPLLRPFKSLTFEDAGSLCQDFSLHNTDDNCFCNPETGLVGCTLYLQHSEYEIGGGPIRISKSLKTPEPQYENCPNGLHFPSSDGCNSCFCVPQNGAIGCTLMACPESLRPSEKK